MSLAYNSSIVRDGLVFHFDLDNKKSWKGKPTTNLKPDMTLDGINGISATYIGKEDGWDKYSLSGTWNAGTYPYSLRVSSYGFTGGVTYTTSLKIKTNVPEKFYGQFTYVNYVNELKTKGGTPFKQVLSDGSFFIGRKGFEYTNTTSQPGYLDSRPLSDGTTFDPNTDFVYIKEGQIEEGEFPTKFVDGQRLDTASIIDIAKKNTITPVNLTYQEGVGPQFDGTNDYIDLGPSSIYNITNEASAFAIIDMNNAGGWNGIWGASTGGGFIHFQVANGYLNVYVYGPNAGYSVQEHQQMLQGYHHVGFTFGQQQLRIYIDGVQQPTVVSAGSGNISQVSSTSVGKVYDDNRYMNGSISSLQVYNKKLTEAEVQKNFAASRSRYGI